MPATAHITFTRGLLLGNWTWSVIWSKFSPPQIPADAVIHGIYPVCSAVRAGTVGDIAYASVSVADHMLRYFWDGGLTDRVLLDKDSSGASISGHPYIPVGFSGLLHANSIGTDPSVLAAWSMQAALFGGLGSSMTDVLDVANLGFAVYYTTATGETGNTSDILTEPFAIPAGQSVAWSIPLAVTSGDENGTNASTNGSAIGTCVQFTIIPHGVNCNAHSNGGPINPAWPPGNGLLLGDMEPMRNWCRANGISVALTQDSQRSAKDLLDELTTVANCAPVYSGNVLNFIPYDEVSAAGNGAVYRAPTGSGPIAYLTDKDFVRDGDRPPVLGKRKRRTDCDNVVAIEHINRSLDYAHDVTSEPNQCSVAQFGPRKGGTFSAAELGVNLPSGSKSLLSIHSKVVAQKVSSILAKRGAAGANVYPFTLKAEWFGLEAMDFVAITDEAMGLVECPARLLSVKENDDRTLACEAERFIYGLNHPEVMDSSVPSGTLIDIDVDPGLVDTPLIFEPPLTMTDGVPQLWFAVPSDDPAYGGCIAFMSIDGGTTYNPIGSAGQATMGVSTASFATGADPDTVHALDVNLASSLGDLATTTQEEADLFSNPCYLESASGFEVICPTVASLTSAYHYALDTYIRRGAFGTTIASHASGKQFVALDGAILHFDLDAALIGRNLKFKFAAYNQRGGQQNKLSDCVAYSYTPAGVTPLQLFTINGA